MLCKMLLFLPTRPISEKRKVHPLLLSLCAATPTKKKSIPQCDVTKGTSRASDGAVSQVLACERSIEASARENVDGQRAEDAASLNR